VAVGDGVADGLVARVEAVADATVGVEVTEATCAPGCVLRLLATAAVHAPMPTKSSAITPTPTQNERRRCGIGAVAPAARVESRGRCAATHR
jgi:hypothetical protein